VRLPRRSGQGYSGGRGSSLFLESKMDLSAFLVGENQLKRKESRLVMGESVALNKEIELIQAGSAFRIGYQIFNQLKKPVRFVFSCQWMVSFKDAQVNRPGEAGPLRRFSVLDPAVRLEAVWAFSRAARIAFSPLEKKSGERRIYQGAVIRGFWPVTLAPSGRWKLNYEWKVGQPCGGL